MARTPAGKTSKAKATTQRGRATPVAKARARRNAATPSGTSDRKHLIGLIQNTTGCSGQRAKETLNSLLGTIGASLKKNQKVQLIGFGSFVVSKRPAHKARNPATGEAIRVKASKSVRFRPGQTLKRSL
jgi:DNA-binding protein HU-beta